MTKKLVLFSFLFAVVGFADAEVPDNSFVQRTLHKCHKLQEKHVPLEGLEAQLRTYYGVEMEAKIARDLAAAEHVDTEWTASKEDCFKIKEAFKQTETVEMPIQDQVVSEAELPKTDL